jgi:hypothetical protein
MLITSPSSAHGRPDMAFTRFIDAAIREQPLTVIGDGMKP